MSVSFAGRACLLTVAQWIRINAVVSLQRITPVEELFFQYAHTHASRRELLQTIMCVPSQPLHGFFVLVCVCVRVCVCGRAYGKQHH